jgi:hypothetical protein
MPRKSGEKLEKVVSTKISLEDFMVLERCAKISYNKNLLKQPTISHMLRLILKIWAENMRNEEPSSPYYDPSVVPQNNLGGPMDL